MTDEQILRAFLAGVAPVPSADPGTHARLAVAHADAILAEVHRDTEIAPPPVEVVERELECERFLRKYGRTIQWMLKRVASLGERGSWDLESSVETDLEQVLTLLDVPKVT